MAASQDFRDGAATGAATVAVRVRQMIAWGITVDDRMIDKLAEGIVHEYGGRVYVAPADVDYLAARGYDAQAIQEQAEKTVRSE